jgi:predicted DNA-binding transcriptional regulator YafY
MKPMRADRLLSIMMLLQNRGKTTAQVLARELGVSRRTILRDIDALSFAGVPIYAEGGHGGGIALDENYRVSLTGLKEGEVRALFVSNLSRLLTDIGLGQAAEATLPKLFVALPELHKQAVERIRQRVYIDPLWWWHDAQPLPFWDDLQRAVYEDRRVHTTYEHYDGETVERVLEPYSLVAKASLWYLVALRDGEFCTYRVSRFHDVTLLDGHFHRREDFDLAAYWQGNAQQFVATLAQYQFTLRIDSRRMYLARWYTPGRCEVVEPAGEDGWLSARFQVESEDVARTFVLGFGAQATVVEPQALRESVLALAYDVLMHYEQPESAQYSHAAISRRR